MKQIELNNALVKFASLGMTKEVAKSLELGADIHSYDDVALRQAAESGHIETVKLLLQNGADISADDNYALRGAAYCGHIEIVKLLEKYINREI